MSAHTETLSQKAERRRFLRPFLGEALSPPPIWLMRQAGRYLPEYRATRAEAGGFLDLCYNPKLATEVTLQPIRRFAFDASILFSDILVIPHALGQKVWFAEGEGPRLTPIETGAELAATWKPDRALDHLAPVLETVERLRTELPDETALIGFCGAPWTVATYVVAGRGSPDQAAARLWAYRDPDGFQTLIDMLTDASIAYLKAQIANGADVVQIFDSWAGSLPENEFARWVIAPTQRMVDAIRADHPDVPIIGFARLAGAGLRAYADGTGCDAFGCDTAQRLTFARETVGAPLRKPLQGNLDPLLLVAGGSALDAAVDEIVETMAGHPFIFNLGHGIVPQTPPEHVAQMVARVRSHAGRQGA